MSAFYLYLVVALVSASLGVIPLVVGKHLKTAIGCWLLTSLLGWGIFYGNAVSLGLWPLFGVPGFVTAVWWLLATIISSVRNGIEENELGRSAVVSWVVFFGVVFVYAIWAVSGSEMMNATGYANMINTLPPAETGRVWSQDVQELDSAHARIATSESAEAAAKLHVISGTGENIGSQFEIAAASVTTQIVNGEVVIIVPLDFGGYGPWKHTKGVPTYIKVSGEDQNSNPQSIDVKVPLRYTPGAWFEFNLTRHLRVNGYLNKELSDFTLEPDDETGKLWWTVTVSEPTIAWWAEKVEGVAIVDPVNGEIFFKKIGEVPNWVDRAFPEHILSDYLRWNGLYSSGGYGNTWWWAKGQSMTKPTGGLLVYSSTGQPEFVFGITSTSSLDESIVGLEYINSRTGQRVYYAMPKGGATESAVLAAVNSFGEVKNKHLHGVAVQICNVLGTPTAMVPILNESHAFNGVVLMSIENRNVLVYGKGPFEAYRKYEQALSGVGQRAAIGGARKVETVSGVILRKGQEPVDGGYRYFVYLVGEKHLFAGTMETSPKLVIAQPGDRVEIAYYATDEGVAQMRDFDIPSVPLSIGGNEARVRAAEDARRTVEEK